MAKDMRYVTLRGDVFYYERRVPQEVQDRPAAWHTHFGGRRLFRVSLRTKRQIEAMQKGAEVERQFDRLVDLALGRSAISPNARSDQNARAHACHPREHPVEDQRESGSALGTSDRACGA